MINTESIQSNILKFSIILIFRCYMINNSVKSMCCTSLYLIYIKKLSDQLDLINIPNHKFAFYGYFIF